MRNTRFEVRPTSGALGAELLGIDLSEGLDDDALADIRQAFNQHGVIFFQFGSGRDRKSTRLNSSHSLTSRMPSSA